MADCAERGVERSVEQEHIDAWLAENPELALLGMLSYEGSDCGGIGAARVRHSRHLQLR